MQLPSAVALTLAVLGAASTAPSDQGTIETRAAVEARSEPPKLPTASLGAEETRTPSSSSSSRAFQLPSLSRISASMAGLPSLLKRLSDSFVEEPAPLRAKFDSLFVPPRYVSKWDKPRHDGAAPNSPKSLSDEVTRSPLGRPPGYLVRRAIVTVDPSTTGTTPPTTPTPWHHHHHRHHRKYATTPKIDPGLNPPNYLVTANPNYVVRRAVGVHGMGWKSG